MKSFLVALLPLALAACVSNESSPGTTTTETTTSSTDTSTLTQKSLVSECGGFAKTKVDPPTPDASTYCDAEQLLWVYDAATQSLGLTDARMVLNCCGEHSITVAVDDAGKYVVSERDAPEDVGGSTARCNCMCVFDFGVSVEPVPAGSIDVRVVLDVTDSGEAEKVVYEGSIDLSQGSGAIVIDGTSADPWCGQMP
ncbi:MAG: hypothetical protein U0441_32715 [Polyangiaceae bacterium]